MLKSNVYSILVKKCTLIVVLKSITKKCNNGYTTASPFEPSNSTLENIIPRKQLKRLKVIYTKLTQHKKQSDVQQKVKNGYFYININILIENIWKKSQSEIKGIKWVIKPKLGQAYSRSIPREAFKALQ